MEEPDNKPLVFAVIVFTASFLVLCVMALAI